MFGQIMIYFVVVMSNKLSFGPASFLFLLCVEEGKHTTHSHSHCGGNITPFIDFWLSYHFFVCFVLFVFFGEFFCTFLSQSAHLVRRRVGVSKLVVCYAGDF